MTVRIMEVVRMVFVIVTNNTREVIVQLVSQNKNKNTIMQSAMKFNKLE